MEKYKKVEVALSLRNSIWQNDKQIPKWVDIETVDLDQFFTKPEIANHCYNKFISFLKEKNMDFDDLHFLEPSAGNGSFFKLLPDGNKTGLDIMPLSKGICEADFLSWEPRNTKKQIVTIGNPPFGYRSWLALAFINHAAKFSKYIGFILPMAFQSEGKGSPKYRVKGMRLVSSELLPKNSFMNTEGRTVQVNGLWQIWERGENQMPVQKKCSSYIELFTVDQRKERLCGHNRMHEADYFLQRTFYGEPPTLVKNFSDVKYVCGYGIVIKNNKSRVLEILNNTDWIDYSNLATHNCRHISMYHIQKALTDQGLIDD